MKRKITLTIIAALLCIIHSNAQVKIGDNPTVIDSSAILELKSSSKGLLIPRMTQAERNSITSPATGLMIYQTDSISGFYYYNGSTWTNIGSGITNESDPVFNASAANGINLIDINNWNNAYNWGNHIGLYRPNYWVPDWNEIINKPNLFNGSWYNLTDTPILTSVAITGDYNDLINTPSIFSGSYYDLTDKPIQWDSSWTSIKNKPILFNGTWASLTGKPAFSTVSVTGKYNDLINKPSLFSGIYSDLIGKPTQWDSTWASIKNKPIFFDGDFNSLSNKPGLFDGNWTSLSGKPAFATIASTGNYNDINNKPVLFSGNYSDLINKPLQWDSTWASIKNKPIFFDGDYNSLLNKPSLFDGSWTSLTNKPSFFDGDYNSLSNKPGLFDGNWSSLSGKPVFATIASTGNYNDINNKPILFSGNYSDLTNKPTQWDSTWVSIKGKPSIDTSATNELQTISISNDTIFLSNGGFVKIRPSTVLFPPSVSILPTTNLQSTSVTLNGIVNGKGLFTTVIFEWGLSTSYGNTVSISQNAVTGDADINVSANITGLQSATTYHYRIKATNAVNLANSNDFSFTTLASVPQLTTNNITAITATSATSGGNITTDGGSSVTARGICYYTSTNPTIANSLTSNGTGSGSFVSDISGLTPTTIYYVRAYATNSIGTAYGNEVSFTPTIPLTTDIDGNVYNTVVIGTQVWMKENLKVTKYRNGDLIGTTSLDISLESFPKYQWASNGNEAIVADYGRLYTWYVVADSRNLCPSGWHVPSDAEWTTLTSFLGGESIAGGKLKETGLSHWNGPNTAATNETGFTALPGGCRNYYNEFNGVGNYSNWWSSTEVTTTYAWYRDLGYDYGNAYRSNSHKRSGFSVRCLKD